MINKSKYEKYFPDNFTANQLCCAYFEFGNQFKKGSKEAKEFFQVFKEKHKKAEEREDSGLHIIGI